MRAFVSGQSGIALLNEGGEWSVLRDAGGPPLQGQFSSAVRLLDGSTDIEEVRDAIAQDIGLELAAARAKDTALQYVLVLLQETELGELERRILERLKHLLFFPEIPEFILNRLYAAPLGSSDRARVRALIAEDRQHPVSAIFRSVLRDQASISGVRSEWENISTGRFRSVEDKDEFFFSAVERGLVRRLTQDPQGVLRETAEIVDGSSEMLRSWAEATGAALGPVEDKPTLPKVSETKAIRGEDRSSDAKSVSRISHAGDSVFSYSNAINPEIGSSGDINQGDSSWVELVERARRGHPSALEELYRVFYVGIRFYLSRQIGPQDVDDKIHDLFLTITQSIQRGDLREPERLMEYVRTIVRRQVAAHIDNAVQARRKRTDMEYAVELSDLRSTAERDENLEVAMRILNSLHKREREVLMRFYLKEQTADQICSDLDLTETQFRLIKSRAKARFGELGKRRLVQRTGLPPAYREESSKGPDHKTS